VKIVKTFVKTIATLTLVIGLMFSSALFTVLLYAKITGHDYTADNYDHSVVHAESLEPEIVDAVEEVKLKTAVEAPIAPSSAMLDAPLIMQYPELPRGCEITSLTMLLQFYGVDKGKMELLPEMNRDTTPIEYNLDGSIKYWGNPYVGFVGDITLDSVGFGIYHSALFDLLATYIPSALDLTGGFFQDLEQQIAQGIPVMVWTTVRYEVPDKWVEWDTPAGPIRTTFQEHAVLLVGFDEENVYVNDPLKNRKNVKINKAQFTASWKAMGQQALSYTHQN
jgi:uncharacterized protein YvpB